MTQLLPVQRCDHVAKSDLTKNFAKFVKVFENKVGQVVDKSFDFVLCLFGVVEGMKFRDSSEYLDCVQNIWEKSCLPCQILYIANKNFAEREKA